MMELVDGNIVIVDRWDMRRALLAVMESRYIVNEYAASIPLPAERIKEVGRRLATAERVLRWMGAGLDK